MQYGAASYYTLGQICRDGLRRPFRRPRRAGPPAPLVTSAPPAYTAPDFRVAIRRRLTADAAIANIVGTRIRPGALAQGDTQPALTYQVISNIRGHHLAGAGGIANAVIQFDCLARTQAEAVALKIALESALDGMVNRTLDGITFSWIGQTQERDFHEPPRPGSDTWQYRVTVDYRVKYRTSITVPN